MYSIKITKEAETALSEIYVYISSVLKNPIAADNLLNEIESSFKALIDTPEMYALCNDIHLRQYGYRKIVIKNYLIFYKINTAANNIYIMRIIYGKREYIDII